MKDSGKFGLTDHRDFLRGVQVNEAIDPGERPGWSLANRLWFSLYDLAKIPVPRRLHIQAVDPEAKAEFRVWAEPSNSFNAEEMMEVLQNLIALYDFNAGELLFYISPERDNTVMPGKIVKYDPATDKLEVIN